MNYSRLLAVTSFLALPWAALAQPSLTIYNQDFAVVRDLVRLDLRQGTTELRFNGTATHLEPDSVMLRDPSGTRNIKILEQNFRNDPVSQDLLLSMFEGQTIQFETVETENGQLKKKLISGKIVRSGYVPHYEAMSRYGQRYSNRQNAYAYGSGSQPIIEVDGKIRFSLPGLPLFPALNDDAMLKPSLTWLILSDKPGRLDTELSYITGGLSWEASYNAVAPEKGDTLDITGWVTMDNQSGKSYEDARIKLLAGDVNRIRADYAQNASMLGRMAERDETGAVSEKTFDEYHLYALPRATSLLDRETKQVEFIRAANVPSKPAYIYDGAKMDQYQNWNPEAAHNNREYGTQMNPKVWVMREIYNSLTNRLGMPLPKGRLRFYRRDTDGQMEFTGESLLDHTAQNELIRVFTGNAFDLAGERRQIDFKVDTTRNWADESFEIKLRNHKKEPATIRVVEHLYRWANWEIAKKSDEFTKTDARTIEFRVEVKPNEEKVVHYTAHYTW